MQPAAVFKGTGRTKASFLTGPAMSKSSRPLRIETSALTKTAIEPSSTNQITIEELLAESMIMRVDSRASGPFLES